MSTTLTRPPVEIAVGETVDFSIELEDFAPSDGWAVSYFFRGPVAVDLAGVPNGGAFDFSIIGATFATVGGYQWEAIAVNVGTSERCRLSSGLLHVVEDLQTNAGTASVTTHNERMLAALEAALENTATSGQRSYAIAGRSLERMTMEELRTNRDIYARRVDSERTLAAKGLKRAPRRVGMVLR